MDSGAGTSPFNTPTQAEVRKLAPEANGPHFAQLAPISGSRGQKRPGLFDEAAGLTSLQPLHGQIITPTRSDRWVAIIHH